VTGVATHRGTVYDPALANFPIPKLDGQLNPPFNVDGHSHFPIFIADNSDFGPPGSNPLGAYTWQLKLVDQTGSGWQVNATFAVI
jgi:hypothetical protein